MELRIKISILFLFFGYVTHAQIVNLRFVPEWFIQRFESLKLNQTYELGAYLKPLYLEADFDGDEKKDIVALLINSGNKKLGLLIIFRESNKHFIIGAGNDFGPSGDNLEWVDSWEIFDQHVTHETTFFSNGDIDGIREIVLKNFAISIRDDEGSGGLVYYNGLDFIWIHQGD